MDLKKHGFWVAMGALAAVAGGLFLWLVIFGVNAAISEKGRKLEATLKSLRTFASKKEDEAADPLKGIPTPEVVEYWRKKREALKAEAEKIEARYKERDRAFERIFEANAQGQVELAKFVSELRNRADRDLKEAYKTLFEENFAKVLPVVDPAPQKDEEISFAQKKYYIARDLLEAAKAGGAKTLVSVAFKEPEKPDPKAPPREVDAIEVEAVLKMPAPGVTKLVSQLFRAKTCTFALRELSMEAAPFSYPELEPWKVFEMPQNPQGGTLPGQQWRSFPRDVFVGVQDTADPKSKNGPPEMKEPPVVLVKEPPVLVRVVLRALDFNFPEKQKS